MDGADDQRLGIAGIQSDTGAAGTMYFEPGGVAFWAAFLIGPARSVLLPSRNTLQTDYPVMAHGN